MEQPKAPLTPEQQAARQRTEQARQRWEQARNRAIRNLAIAVAVVAVLWFFLSR